MMRRLLTFLLVFTLVAVLNVRGRPCRSLGLKHGKMWFLNVAREKMKDEFGREITKATHPKEFTTELMINSYEHGWPLTAISRSPYLGDHWVIADPDYSPRSSQWPIDSASIVVNREAIAVDLLVGVVFIVFGAGLFMRIITRRESTQRLDSQHTTADCHSEQ